MVKCDVSKYMRKAGLPITNEILPLRENGIEKFLNNDLSDEDAIELVKLYYTGKCANDTLDVFVETFKKEDNTFSDDLINEIQMLAGIVLCEVVLRNEWEDTISLIEIYANIYYFLGYSSICDDIVITMITDFDDRRKNIRENINIGEKKLTSLKNVSFSGAEEALEYNEKVVENLNNLVKKVNETVRAINSMVTSEWLNMNILHEDSQMLWWLMTERTDINDHKYSEMDYKISTILMGADLAKRVSLFPGPFAAKKLLSKGLSFGDIESKFKFESFIEALDERMIASIIGSKDVDTPVLYALKKKAENGSGCWSNAFSKMYAKVKAEYSVIDMAYETYLECMLLNYSNE